MRDLPRTILAGVAGALSFGVLIAASGPLGLRNDGIQFPDGSVQTTAAGGDARPLYYLEVGPPGYDGASPIGACDPGFHFASIFEILDPSNLRYDTTRGAVAADSGSGPPQTSQGWVRTGDIASNQATPGFANCASPAESPWASNLPGDNGTYVWFEDPLAADWNSPASRIAPWSAGIAPCSIPLGVWCIEDFPGAGA